MVAGQGAGKLLPYGRSGLSTVVKRFAFSSYRGSDPGATDVTPALRWS